MKRITSLFLALSLALSFALYAGAVQQPAKNENSSLLWQKRLVSDWTEAIGGYALSDTSTPDAIFAAFAKSLVKLDCASGEELARAELPCSVDYGGAAPTVCDGKVFLPLPGGMVCAFSESDLSLLWQSQGVGGSALTPITVCDGLIYTGFRQSDTLEGAFVCLDASTGEQKWRNDALGGFFGAGACVIGDTVIYGTDNGAEDSTSEGARLISQNALSGELISELALSGDCRTSITEHDGRIYAMTTSGSVISAKISEIGELTDVKTASVDAPITSRPAFWRGRMYLGAGDFAQGFVAVLSCEDLHEIYRFTTPAAPQCALLALSGDDFARIYFTYNALPGEIAVFTDTENAESAAWESLFTPEETLRNWCAASVICDENGVFYYTNDSGSLFAVGRTASAATMRFRVTPQDAEISLTHDGEPVAPNADGSYTLPSGEYTYTVSKSGYITKTDSVTIENSEPRLIELSLSAVSSGGESRTISVSFTLYGDTVHGEQEKHSFSSDKSRLPIWIPTTRLSLKRSATALDALRAALADTDIELDATPSSTYITGLCYNGEWLSELSNGATSGWMFMVNGVDSKIGSAQYALKSGDKLIWYYSDDFTEEQSGKYWASTYKATQTAPPDTSDASTPDTADASTPDTDMVLPDTDEVSGRHWAAGYIAYLTELGALKSLRKEQSPDAPILRGELINVLASQSTPDATASPFSDVTASSPYYKAVCWASKNRIVLGAGGARLFPDASLTRQDLCVILVRYAKFAELSLAEGSAVAFSDSSSISPYAKDAVDALSRAGIVGGRNGFFRPQDSASYAEACKMLALLINQNGATLN